MPSDCVHGFNAQHCSQCRTCPHGLTTSRCNRCTSAVAIRAAAKLMPPPQPSEEHRGFEIFFIPQQRSWYYRDDPDAPLPRDSYRSAFLAKAAINAALDAAPQQEGAATKR
jgi:hypothetical protein